MDPAGIKGWPSFSPPSFLLFFFSSSSSFSSLFFTSTFHSTDPSPHASSPSARSKLKVDPSQVDPKSSQVKPARFLQASISPSQSPAARSRIISTSRPPLVPPKRQERSSVRPSVHPPLLVRPKNFLNKLKVSQQDPSTRPSLQSKSRCDLLLSTTRPKPVYYTAKATCRHSSTTSPTAWSLSMILPEASPHDLPCPWRK